MKKPLIIYHSPCMDGFTAAWAAYEAIKGELYPTNYDKPIPKSTEIKGRDVYIVDFCYKPNVLIEMCKHARKVVILDHHLSSMKEYEDLLVEYLPLSSGKEIIIDKKDLNKVKKHTWTEHTRGGAFTYIKNNPIYLHRFLLDVEDDSINVDHKNRNPLDNRRCNLRIATKQQNAANMDRGSEWKGITKKKNNKWVAQIMVDYKHHYLGIYDTPEEAAKAYDAAAILHFGEYARGNFFTFEPPKPLPKNLEVIFDMERSGAGITWDYFAWGARPWLVWAVEDRDLWRFKFKETKAQTAFIATFDQTIDNWNYLGRICKPGEAEAKGEAILKFHKKVVKDTAQKVQMVKFEKDGPIVPVVNSLYEFNSELGNVLAKDNPYSVCWYMGESPTDVFISFRSSADNPNYIDVSEVARRFGGGGHKHASGCKVSLDYIVSILKGEI